MPLFVQRIREVLTLHWVCSSNRGIVDRCKAAKPFVRPAQREGRWARVVCLALLFERPVSPFSLSLHLSQFYGFLCSVTFNSVFHPVTGHFAASFTAAPLWSGVNIASFFLSNPNFIEEVRDPLMSVLRTDAGDVVSARGGCFLDLSRDQYF